jgi:biotin operon repressor
MGGSTKQALLQALSAAEGAYISGQQLAEALGVSRAAVHKAAQALSAQGYALDSAPRRGYWQAATPSAPKRWALIPLPSTSTTHCKAPT